MKQSALDALCRKLLPEGLEDLNRARLVHAADNGFDLRHEIQEERGHDFGVIGGTRRRIRHRHKAVIPDHQAPAGGTFLRIAAV